MTASAEIVTLFLGNALLVPNRALRFSPPTESRMPHPTPADESHAAAPGSTKCGLGRTRRAHPACGRICQMSH